MSVRVHDLWVEHFLGTCFLGLIQDSAVYDIKKMRPIT